jgi:hypothetical protein
MLSKITTWLIESIIAVIIACIVVLIGGSFWYMEYGTEHTVTFTVKSLDDQATGNSHQYMIFTTDGQVYQDTDAWFHGKTDSSNVYDFLSVGDTYTCPVYGIRSTLFSSYEDILDGCKQAAG